jgi:cell division protein FtsA
MRDIDIYARDQVELAVRIGKPDGITGVCEEILKPEYATAIGLMMANAEITPTDEGYGVAKGKKAKKNKGGDGFLKKIFDKFK